MTWNWFIKHGFGTTATTFYQRWYLPYKYQRQKYMIEGGSKQFWVICMVDKMSFPKNSPHVIVNIFIKVYCVIIFQWNLVLGYCGLVKFCGC
jgi:hypothetical protein